MKGVDDMVRAALREQAAAQAPAEPMLAERVLTAHRRRAGRRTGVVAAAVAAVVGLAFWSPLPGGSGTAPAGEGGPSVTEVVGRPEQSPPREVIAAGDVVMAAYVEQRTVASGTPGRGELLRTYWLLDPDSQTYEKDERWSLVAVAPGALQAAVLERDLPVRRIGVLDLRTREVERWIELEGDERQGVAGLAFSRDGASLLATTYRRNPDSGVSVPQEDDRTMEQVEAPFDSGRSGFWVVDVGSGRSRWSAVEAPGGEERDPFLTNVRQDFEFTHDGRAVRAGLISDERSEFHDLDGAPIAPPAGEAHWEWSVEAGRSPDGDRMAGPFAGETRKTSSWILDARTGKRVAEVPGQQLLAWAGDDSLVAWDIDEDGGSEFGNRLVLVTIGSDRTVPLSGPRGDRADAGGRWQPLFVRR
ncbi:WD40 repeat domain-containing protein [Streptomyces abyssomicinicus]|uniref:WD40 repeat domain-containing protein n=1 Tax=Streptomyces abyssomicinicus TaxID=574929 RepID=UPI001FEADFF4|nr:WD40 repeat domain-containing protein [Streptomyces abyssomicinicus]